MKNIVKVLILLTVLSGIFTALIYTSMQGSEEVTITTHEFSYDGPNQTLIVNGTKITHVTSFTYHNGTIEYTKETYDPRWRMMVFAPTLLAFFVLVVVIREIKGGE